MSPSTLRNFAKVEVEDPPWHQNSKMGTQGKPFRAMDGDSATTAIPQKSPSTLGIMGISPYKKGAGWGPSMGTFG